MKKISLILLAILFIIVSSATAQDDGLKKLMTKYGKKDGVSIVNISSEMFNMMSNLDVDGDKDMDQIIDRLEGLKILTIEHKEAGVKAASFYEEVMGYFPKEDYKEIMTVDDKEDHVVFLAKKKNGKLQELIMVASDPEETVVMRFAGELLLSDFSKLSRTFNIEGMDKLEDIDD